MSTARPFHKYKSLQQFANAVARSEGFQRATEIRPGPETKILDYTRFGYRKYTTGQYVPNAYLNNFGWKNTYYQHAKTVVQVKYAVYVFFTALK